MPEQPTAPTDLDLVRRIKAGDEMGFEEMVDRYHARVYSLSYGVLRNAEDAEEATQDTFLTLYRKIGTFDESKKFFSWFYRVALNSAYSRARRRPAPTVAIEEYLPKFSPNGHLSSPVEVVDFRRAIDDAAAAREMAARAEEFMAELPPAYRASMVYDIRRCPRRRSRRPSRSPPRLQSRLHRARLYVRQRLAEIASARKAEAAG